MAAKGFVAGDKMTPRLQCYRDLNGDLYMLMLVHLVLGIVLGGMRLF